MLSITKYCAHLHHILAALKRNFPASLVAPLPITHAASDTTGIHSTFRFQRGSSGCQKCKSYRNFIHLFRILAIAARSAPPSLSPKSSLHIHTSLYPPLAPQLDQLLGLCSSLPTPETVIYPRQVITHTTAPLVNPFLHTVH